MMYYSIVKVMFWAGPLSENSRQINRAAIILGPVKISLRSGGAGADLALVGVVWVGMGIS